jgi:hypothetical protein
MTLEQCTAEALAAAWAGDLNALETALRHRRNAIATLDSSAESVPRIEEALRAGESIAQAVLALKRRIGTESARLRQLQTGLSTGLGVSRKTRIDFRG